jgi:uncharacterized repeat protein (TIGR01451 family)
MEKNNKQYKGLILILVLFLSLLLCNGVSATNASDVKHTSTVNKVKSINLDTTTKKISSNAKSSYKTNNITYKTSYLPGYYDLRKLGKLTPIKDQGFSGTCWAFAVMGSLESNLLPHEKWNFSENNMKNLLSKSYKWGFDRSYDDAGCWQEALAYLTRYSGPITAAQDPYDEFSGTSPTSLKPVKHVQETVQIMPRNSTGTMNNNDLKYAIIKYGAIYSLMTYDDSYLNYNNYGYYYNGTGYYNHAICIVGWDDNYSKNNFLNGAPGNGAFIIRNSWGSNWGDKGYFYVSYYDKYLANSDDNIVFMDAESTKNYDNIYQYDLLGDVGNYGFESDTAWFSNIFTAKSKELLKAASFYVHKPNSAYNLYIYLNPVGNNPVSGSLVAFKNGIISTAGYKTIQLDNFIKLIKNQRFSVVVKLVTPDETEPISIEYPLYEYSSKATARSGQSYVSIDGNSWVDMTKIISNANVCLKAFTSSMGSDLSITKKVSDKNSLVMFTIKVTNNGPETALNVKLNEKLSPELSFLSYICNYGIYNSETGKWIIGTLPNGAVATIIIKFVLTEADNFSNKFYISSSTYDPILINNIAVVDLNQSTNLKNHPLSGENIHDPLNTLPMQNTGTLVIPIIMAILIMVGGFVSYKKN